MHCRPEITAFPFPQPVLLEMHAEESSLMKYVKGSHNSQLRVSEFAQYS